MYSDHLVQSKTMDSRLSEWRAIVDPLNKKEYVGLFGLSESHAAYFTDKDVLEGTPMTIFDDVIRSALLHYAAPREGVVLSSLRIKFADIDLIYGYVHSFGKPGEPLEPQFYNMAGSLVSLDGEYRKDLVPARQFNVAMTAFPQFFDIIIPYLTDLVETEQIKVSYQHFPESANPVLGALPLYILAIAWFNDYFAVDIGILDKHIYGPRREMVSRLPGASKVYSQIKSLKGFSVLDFTAVIKYPDSRLASFNCGQKLIPMLRKDVANPFDITLQTWRELYINEEVALLMMNNIALGFAFTAGWYYIAGANADMFDNTAMKDKYANSAIAGQINKELGSAVDLTYKDTSAYPTDDPRHDIQTPIDDKFAKLRDEIIGDIGFVNSHLKLSDRAICMMSVHTNVTISNVWLLAKVHKSCPLLEIPIFSRIVFDYLYSLYCLNARIGALHGDLHINNATVMRLQMRADRKFGNTAYVIGDQFYSLRYDGVLGCVIDFSRGVIGDMSKIAHSYGSITANQLRIRQITQLLQLIERHFPALYKVHKLKLEFLSDDDFDRLFRICTIIDAYSLTSGIHTMLTADDRYAQVPKDVAEWVSSVAAACEEIFSAELGLALEHSAPLVDLPMLQLIKRIYADRVITWPPAADAPVSHVVNSGNPLKYGIDDPKTWNRIVHPKIALDACLQIPGRDCSNYISANWDYVAARRDADNQRIREIAKEYQGGVDMVEDDAIELCKTLTDIYGYNDPEPFADIV